MTKLDWDQFIEEVRRANPVPEFLAEFTRVRRGSGENVLVDCPFCRPGNFEHGRAKSDRYRCFRASCTTFGDRWVDIFDLAPELLPQLKGATEGETFWNAVKYLAERAGLSLPTRQKGGEEPPEVRQNRLYRTAISFYQYILAKTPEALEYLKSRGITENQIQRYNMGYAPGGKTLYQHLTKKGFSHQEIVASGLCTEKGYDFFRRRVIIDGNVLQGGTLYGRSIDKDEKVRHLYLPGRMNGLFGLKVRTETVLLSEGFFDALLQERAIEWLNEQNKKKHLPLVRWGSIASYGTCGFKEEYIDDLKQAGVKNIIITMDGDNPGLTASLKIAEMLRGHFNIRVAVFPDGEDPNSFILQHGMEEWLNVIQRSLTLVEFKVKMVLDSYKLNDTTERVLAANEIANILEQENEIVRDIMVQEVAAKLRVSTSAIYKFMETIKKMKRPKKKLLWFSA